MTHLRLLWEPQLRVLPDLARAKACTMSKLQGCRLWSRRPVAECQRWSWLLLASLAPGCKSWNMQWLRRQVRHSGGRAWKPASHIQGWHIFSGTLGSCSCGRSGFRLVPVSWLRTSRHRFHCIDSPIHLCEFPWAVLDLPDFFQGLQWLQH